MQHTTYRKQSDVVKHYHCSLNKKYDFGIKKYKKIKQKTVTTSIDGKAAFTPFTPQLVVECLEVVSSFWKSVIYGRWWRRRRREKYEMYEWLIELKTRLVLFFLLKFTTHLDAWRTTKRWVVECRGHRALKKLPHLRCYSFSARHPRTKIGRCETKRNRQFTMLNTNLSMLSPK